MKSLQLGQYRLAWAEYGAPEGEPVLYFHGMPGSRLEVKPADAIARDLGIRLIAPDRPGYGDSDNQVDRQDNMSMLDWPDVVSQLADKLNLGKFSILGNSAGTAYALACAHKISDRIKHVTLVSGVAPFETEVMQTHINADFKQLYELAMVDYPAAIQQVSLLAPSPEVLLRVMQSQFPASDTAVFEQTHNRKDYLENITLALATDVSGIVNDLRCTALPWQFNLDEIDLNIDIWHGREDNNVGFPVAEYLAEILPHSATHFLENKGHFYIYELWRDILEISQYEESMIHGKDALSFNFI